MLSLLNRDSGLNRAKHYVEKIKKHVPLVIANVLILYLSISGWNYYDVRYFIRWHDEYFAKGRVFEIYTTRSQLKVSYPPLAVLIFTTIHGIAVTLFPVNIIMWRLIDKLPLIISFNLIYFILRGKYGKLPAMLWLLSFVSYVVIYTYQFDLIVSLFILLAIVNIEKRNYSLYGLYVTLAALIKHFLGVLLILPLIGMLKRRDYGNLFKYISTVSITLSIFISPFFIVDPVGFIDKVILFHTRRPPQNLSIWAIPVYLVKYDISLLPSFINNAWIIPFTIFLLIILREFTREIGGSKICELDLYVKYIVLIIAGFLLLGKVGNINYFLWLTPPLLILITRVSDIDREKTRKLCKVYLYIGILIGFLFGYIMNYVNIVIGYPVFVFEDWNWVSFEEIFIRGYAYEFFDTNYLVALYMGTIPIFREISISIVRTHYYYAILLCILYALLLSYIVKTTRGYRRERCISSG